MKISTRQLHKSFKDADRDLTILQSLNYDFPENKSIAIVGRSGIGKSTLLHILGGLDRPTSGSITFDGQDICALSADDLARFRGRNVGFVFQFHHLLPEFSALENVAMPLIIGGAAPGQAEDHARQLLELVGLSHRSTHRPGQLSGGEQQRVAMARALITSPSVVLADEPTGNLDIKTAQSVQELLVGIHKELQNTLIVVTHNQELASSMDIVLEMMPGGELHNVRGYSE